MDCPGTSAQPCVLWGAAPAGLAAARRPAHPFSASQVINKTSNSFHSTASERPVVLCSCCGCARCFCRLKCVLRAGFVPSLCPTYDLFFFLIFLCFASNHRTRCWCLEALCRRCSRPAGAVDDRLAVKPGAKESSPTASGTAK